MFFRQLSPVVTVSEIRNLKNIYNEIKRRPSADYYFWDENWFSFSALPLYWRLSLGLVFHKPENMRFISLI